MMNVDGVILQTLQKPFPRRGGVSFSLLGLPALAGYKQQTIKNGFGRLKKQGFITMESRIPVVTEKGKRYLKERNVQLRIFASPFAKHSAKNLIVMFDIPEARKAERGWFRRQLREFGYEMIQKSVWFGPSPLPKTFVEYVKSIGLADVIKTFRVSKPMPF